MSDLNKEVEVNEALQQVSVNGIVIQGTVTASAVADISETAAEMSVAEREKFNAVLAALRANNIIATAA